MGTTIRALGTFRNSSRLPGGMVRRGRTVEVSDTYAKQLVETGKAEYVTGDPEEDSTESDTPDTSDTGGSPSAEQSLDLDSMPLPKETPKRDLLEDNGLDTLADLRHFVENDLLTEIKGVGPATAEKLEALLEDTLFELG